MARLHDPGPRGGGWVLAQFLLLGLIALAGLKGPRWPGGVAAVPRLLWAAPTAAFGLYLFFAGGAGLGRLLTPFPRPVANGEVRRRGAYGIVRHPIYGGVLLLSFTWTLVTSPAALPFWLVTVAFFDAKRRREEAWLTERHPEYDQYRREVRHAFLPYVW